MHFVFQLRDHLRVTLAGIKHHRTSLVMDYLSWTEQFNSNNLTKCKQLFLATETQFKNI